MKIAVFWQMTVASHTERTSCFRKVYKGPAETTQRKKEPRKPNQ